MPKKLIDPRSSITEETSRRIANALEYIAIASHAEGQYTIARGRSQHAFGEYNAEGDTVPGSAATRGKYIETVGNGQDVSHRSNARTLDWNGNEELAGNLTLGKGTADEVTITAAQLKSLLAMLT